jgi:PAT family beta-lactamase induction signal transducer AmpG
MLAVVAGLYFVEGFPMGIFRGVWGAWLRQEGMELSLIGAVSGLYLAWSLKALWSPLVDRFGERRHWIAGALCVMALANVGLASTDAQATPLLIAWMALFCLASATQDIAIDAYTIGFVPAGREGPVNAVRIAAYRVGLLATGGGLLLLPNQIGWPATHGVAAGLCALLAPAVWFAPRVPIAVEARKDWRGAFRSWRQRPHLWSVAAFVLLFRLSDFALGPMLNPFWIDRGLSLEEIALLSNTGGMFATIAGAAVGGFAVARLGIGRALWLVGIAAAATNAFYAAAALPGAGRAAIYSAALLEAFGGGAAVAGFMSFLMRICEAEHAAVQYAVLTGLYALAGTLVGMTSGWLTEAWGYSAYFAATALCTVPAFLFLPRARTWLGEGD